MDTLLAGAIAMAYLVCALFFLRFWRQTRDRLFLAFAVSFLLLCGQRVGLVLLAGNPEASLALYVVRLLAFVFILLAILDKNRPARR